MSRSPYATQSYLKNKVSPLHQYNRTEAIINNNTRSIAHTNNFDTFNEAKENSTSKKQYLNFQPTDQVRNKAQSNTQSWTFQYQPKSYGNNFYPCTTKNDESQFQLYQPYINNNHDQFRAKRNSRPSSQVMAYEQFTFPNKVKSIAIKTQQNRITDKLTNLQDKIAKMKAALNEKKNQFRSFATADKSENKIKRENSQIEKNKNNSITKLLKSQKRRKKNNTEGLQLLSSPKQYLKLSNFKNSPLFNESQNQNKHQPIIKIENTVSNGKYCNSISYNPYSPRKNWIYYVSQIVRAYNEKQCLVRQHVQTSLGILRFFKSCKIPPIQMISDKCVYLAKPSGYQKKKTVIFDLDQTLVHCNQTSDLPYHEKISVKLPNGQQTYANISIRPYAKQILRNLNPYFEIIIFTASHSCYANAVIDLLDPQKKYIHHRLFRQQCIKTNQGMYVKDLRILNRSLLQMVLVDNAAYSYAYQVDNGIPIIPYYQGQNDFELQALQNYLYKILNVEDVREPNRKNFKLSYYPNYLQTQSLIKQLYL